MMEMDSIIHAIDAEIEKLQKVRALLSGDVKAATRTSAPVNRISRRRRRLSPEARKRIADAQKKRWAAVNAAKESTKPAESKEAKKGAPVRKRAFKKASAKTAKKAAEKKDVRKVPVTKPKKTTVQRNSPSAPNKTATLAATEAASS